MSTKAARDRLVDRVFNWGSQSVVQQRIQALLDHGATSIIVGASPSDPRFPASIWTTLEALAPGAPD